MYRRFGGMGSGMVFAWIIPLILIVIIGVAVYMILKNKKEDNKTKSNPALDILNVRFAKGEIDESEYLKKKKNLSSFK